MDSSGRASIEAANAAVLRLIGSVQPDSAARDLFALIAPTQHDTVRQAVMTVIDEGGRAEAGDEICLVTSHGRET